MAPESKHQLRTRILAARDGLGPEDRHRRSLLIQERFLDGERYRAARVVALYAAIRGEVETEAIFTRAREQGKQVCYPRVRPGTRELDFHRVDDLDELEPGAFGIPEPAPTAAAQPVETIDLVCVPGVAFDPGGHRVGFGAGFYDRLLGPPGPRPRRAEALAYDFQVLDRVPRDAGDVPVDRVITETRVLP